MDKNSGKLSIICPVKYHFDLKKTFLDDFEHYTNITEQRSMQSILDFFISTYLENGWEKVAPLKKNSGLPYGYILYKNKETSRVRPIVSYFSHPLKEVFFIVQRALSYMLKRIDVRF